MDWLASQSTWVLLAISAVVVVAAAALRRWFVRHLGATHEGGEIRGLAFPLMPALGAAFAVLTAITLSSEAGYLESAQDGVAEEATASARLAWAATSPHVPTVEVHAALERYLV